jgi:hypothetical protein
VHHPSVSLLSSLRSISSQHCRPKTRKLRPRNHHISLTRAITDAGRYRIREWSLHGRCPPYREAERGPYHGSNARPRGIRLILATDPPFLRLPLDPVTCGMRRQHRMRISCRVARLRRRLARRILPGSARPQSGDWDRQHSESLKSGEEVRRTWAMVINYRE